MDHSNLPKSKKKTCKSCIGVHAENTNEIQTNISFMTLFIRVTASHLDPPTSSNSCPRSFTFSSTRERSRAQHGLARLGRESLQRRGGVGRTWPRPLSHEKNAPPEQNTGNSREGDHQCSAGVEQVTGEQNLLGLGGLFWPSTRKKRMRAVQWKPSQANGRGRAHRGEEMARWPAMALLWPAVVGRAAGGMRRRGAG